VDKIAANFDDSKQDPVDVWEDNQGKIWMLSGHHRLAAAVKAGKKDIIARFHQGDEASAIKWAREEANANRAMETPVERAKIYRDKKGLSKKQLREAAQTEGRNASFVLNISALSPDGIVISAYKQFEHSNDKNCPEGNREVHGLDRGGTIQLPANRCA
jgi:ParB-like chromosome segregation protein Spo0J